MRIEFGLKESVCKDHWSSILATIDFALTAVIVISAMLWMSSKL